MKKFIVIALDNICTFLDHIPVPESYIEEGFTSKSYKWYPSGWGCRLRISRLSYLLDERWGTEAWTEDIPLNFLEEQGILNEGES